MLKKVQTDKPVTPGSFKLDEIQLLVFRLGSLKLTDAGDVSLLDYLSGRSFILGKSVPPAIMAKVTLVAFYHARMAFDALARDMKQNHIGYLLNHPTSERVTPRNLTRFCKGLNSRNLLYMNLEAKVVDNSVASFVSAKRRGNVTGDEIVLTDSGVYRWIYEYRPAKATELPVLRTFKKNLTSKPRSVPVKCDFSPMGQKEFQTLFEAQSDLFMNLIHRIYKQVECAQSNVNRISANMQDHKDSIWSIFSKLSYR